MIKPRFKRLSLLCMALYFALASGEEQTNERITVTDIGFATPESVEYYADEDVYLVTNINGDPLAADGNGFISKLNPDGTMNELKWIDGTKKGVTLNAPKGAAIVDNNLFVTDIDKVRIFSLPDGKLKRSIALIDSTFLNGITPGNGSFVYVTDSGYGKGLRPTGTDAIYKVWENGEYEQIIADKNMGHPNGIWNTGVKLVVVTFGSGKIFSVDFDGKRAAMPTPPKGGLDGLVKINDGRFLLSSWDGSAIYALNQNRTFTVLADTLDAPADLGVDTKRKRLLIPLFKLDQVVILPF